MYRSSGILFGESANDKENKKKIQSRADILALVKEKYSKLPLLMIHKSVISLFSQEDMLKLAGPIKITNSDLSGIGSVNDPRMGGESCRIPMPCSYCAQIDCTGHYGLIEFDEPIYNPAFIRQIISVLTCVCNDCGGLLITENIIIEKGWINLPFEKRLSEIENYCKGLKKCLRHKPQIGNGLIIPCDKNPIFMLSDVKDKGEITHKNREEGGKTVPMSISTVITIFNRISPKDSKLMGFNLGNHPINLIMYGCLVPPTTVRPPLMEGTTKREDKLTHMYVGIKKKVDSIRNGKSDSKELYSLIKQLIFKSETNKLGIKDFKSIIERIQGKEELIRGLSMGKRGDYCGRTVAGPDPSLEFGQIRLPQVWARLLTKRNTVTKFNIKYLQNLFDIGQIVCKISSKTGLRKGILGRKSYKLKIGNVVERWLQNGDRVITNRQPTLHRQSKMAYEVVLGKELTIGLHLSYTTPMNCDFDGDENNAWLPRDFEVEAEAEILLNVKNNIMSSEHNRPIMGLVMNSVTSAYLLTARKNKLPPGLRDELFKLIGGNDRMLNFENRLIKFGVDGNSGASVFSYILPPDFYYNQKGILIINGILLSGQLKKSSVGSSHRSIIQDIHKKYGPTLTAKFFTDSARILNKWIMENGFSVGLLDMINNYLDEEVGGEVDLNLKVLNTQLSDIYNKLETLATKLDDPIEENFRQKQITNLSNVTTGIGIKLADDALTPNNSIAVMTEKGAGTKGAVANIGQMMGAVGQQFVYSERIQTTITNKTRTLPTFQINDNNPEAHGFIPTSFFTGLSPEALFFLQTGGRPPLLDTSLKTQETGSLQHKMVKAFENVLVAYDGSVRNALGTLFSPIYNSGYDVAAMMMVDNNLTSFIDIKSLAQELNISNGWIPKDIDDLITENREFLYPNCSIEDNDVEDNQDISYNNIKSDNISQHIHLITKFEKSRLIGTRAKQLSNGAIPIIKLTPEVVNGVDVDPINIALKEYETGNLNLYIIRQFSDGTLLKIYPTLENQ